MAIVNVNMFQEGINNSEYLTKYTDQYLKQSLANLGQRMSVKGDGIYSGSFQIKDLFPKYLGDWSEKGLCANFSIKNENGISALEGELIKFVQKFKDDKEYYEFEPLTNSTEGNSQNKFYLESVSPIITNVGATAETGEAKYSKLTLVNGLNIINDTEYWNGYDTIIQKLANGYLYKTRAINNETHNTFENIFEQVSNSGQLIDGLRIFKIGNENEGTERIFFINIYLDKDDKYKLRFFIVNNTTEISEEDDENILDNIYNILIGKKSDIEELSYYSLPKNIYDIVLESDTFIKDNTYNGRDNLGDIKLYDVDYNTEKNQLLSLYENIIIESIDFNVRVLQYFNRDVSHLFPLIQEVYNDIKFNDENNIKVYSEILGSLLIGPVYQDLLLQRELYAENGEVGDIQKFEITLPVDFEITYNVNSNNPSVIYNSITNTSIQYINNLNSISSEITDTVIIDYLKEVSNYVLDAKNNPVNSNIGILHGYVTKTVLYQFSITYLNESYINKISWFQSFSLPYINSAGFWNINGIDTEVYAYGKDSQKTNFVVLLSTLNNSDYATKNYSDDAKIIAQIISCPYQINQLINKEGDKYVAVEDNWKTKSIELPYLNSVDRDVIDDSDLYTLQACLPSEDFINKELLGSADFNYLDNTIFINLISSTTEKELWEKKYTSQKEIPGYSYYYDEETNSYLWGLFEKKPGTLVSKIGPDGILTTFWTLEYVEESNKYEFRFLSRPENPKIGLDLSYLANLNNLVKFHINNNLEPDKYEHSWVVFDETNKNYKNTILNSENSIWPILKNNNAEDYASSFDVSSSFNNPSNFTIEFSREVKKDTSGMITEVENDLYSKKHWNTTQYINIERIPKDPADYFENVGEENASDDKLYDIVETEINAIEDGIPYRNYNNEFIPNPNIDDTSTIFPYLDLSEVLVKDETLINRLNIVATGPFTYNTKTIWPLYYSYIGTSYEDPDKSTIHIGTSNINPNLGTKTQVDKNTNLTKSKKLSIDFDKIELNGDVAISGHLKNNSNIWKVNTFKDIDESEIVTASTIISPIGKHKTIRLDAKDNLCYSYIGVKDSGELISYIYGNTKQESESYINRISPITDTNDPNNPKYKAQENSYQSWITDSDNFGPKDDNNLFTTVEYVLDENITKSTPYYTAEPDTIKVSYLNVNELLRQEDLYQKTYMVVHSNRPLTYHTYITPENNIYSTYFLELSSDLSNDENKLFDSDTIDIRIANPIEITYTKSIKPISVTTKVDTIQTIATFLYPTSYTELWSCSGCAYCNNPNNCPLMKICDHTTCRGWVTGWEYRETQEINKESIEPNLFEVSRTVPITYYDATGNVILQEVTNDDTEKTTFVETTYKNIKVNLPFPNFSYRIEESKHINPNEDGTYNKTDYPYYYKLYHQEGEEYKVYTSYVNDPGFNQPKFYSKVIFEENQDTVYNRLTDMFGNSNSYQKINDGKIIDDNLGGPLQFTYSYPMYELTNVPLAGGSTYEYYKYTGMYEGSIDVTYSHEKVDKENPTFVETFCYSIYLNIRELLSTHSQPKIYNGIASLNEPNNPDSELGTNKYK